MATLYIDNAPHEIKAGKSLLETCLGLGFDLPYFCWHPALGSVGACRQCAVKVYKDAEDKKGRLVMSCMEPASDNQRISIFDKEAVDFRAGVIEWLMTNHPHDCPVCDEGGACHLQDMTVMTGHAYRRFQYKKRTHTNQDLGPFINHEMNRCIQCYRCVRFYNDYAGGTDFGVFASKANVYFGRYEEGTLENEFSGNLVEVCPTGVFTDKTLKQHYTRKWDLTMSPSICQHCSLGCNIIVGERYGGLRMIANRYHGEVNGYFICDRGRYGYEFVNGEGRILHPVIRQQQVGVGEILTEVATLLKTTKTIGIGSPRASVQSNFVLRELVGKENFYQGISGREQSLAELTLAILKDGPVRTPSMKEVEKSDVVFVLGEDLTNTAPMLALAVRQSIRQQPMKDAEKIKIPDWNDAAVREVIQDKKGPLFVATVAPTKLDGVATGTYRATPGEIARLGFAVAHVLDPTAPAVEGLDEAALGLSGQIAHALQNAERPVVISGSSSQSPAVMQAAANVAWALGKKNRNTGIVLTLPECNSLGLAMVGGKPLDVAFAEVGKGRVDTVIVMENDLYRHGDEDSISHFISGCKNVVVLDHSRHATSDKAHMLIPAGTFAEADGTLVNNEGRAQRFFQVQESANVIKESWRWLLEMGAASGHARTKEWKNFDDITGAISREEKIFSGIDKVSPPSRQRMPDGQRVPRQPHRYSGRTSMLAHLNVSEPKPPEDHDSGMSYTMEGARTLPPSAMVPFFWSPGWNSVQSVNKYQKEIGAALRDGDPGVRLLEQNRENPVKYHAEVPEKFAPVAGRLWLVPVYHIFGSEELSAQSPSVAKRVPGPYLLAHPGDREGLELAEGGVIEFEVEGQECRLPVRWSEGIARGTGGLPIGLKGVPYVGLPAWGIIKK